MPIADRRMRQRQERERRIVDAARTLAERDGWDAVTIRKLADEIEYSQPVLYSHFAGKDAIITAVAMQGFAELATLCRHALTSTVDSSEAFLAVARAYLAFAADHPAVYEAMFARDLDVVFGGDAPAELKEGFTALLDAVATLGEQPRDGWEAVTELAWSALHGIAALAASRRLRPELDDVRLQILATALRRAHAPR
jgi:AcrR family transcriptional regulator